MFDKIPITFLAIVFDTDALCDFFFSTHIYNILVITNDLVFLHHSVIACIKVQGC